MNTRNLLRGPVVGMLAAAGLMLASSPARADVKLPSIFGSDMVLQRESACPVWGWADNGEKVSVEFAGQTHAATAGIDGKWMVRLRPMKAMAEPHTLTVKGKNTVSLSGVLVGEVWLCSGQSNMEWSVTASDRAQEEIAASANPLIRHIKIPHRPAFSAEQDVPSDGWKVSGPANTGSFTAVGYFFARNLVKELNVPVGLIGSNWGGTRIEPWTPPVGFQKTPALKEISDKLDTFPTRTMARDPRNPLKTVRSINFQTPLALYNGMIHPLVPFAIRGALWYQGESNNGEGMLYYEKMKALVNGWRTVWNNPTMPFLFVQLAPYNYGANRGGDLPGIWEAQEMSLHIPHTGMAVTTDIGNVRDIHPRNKQEVGRRLALWALAKTYGKDVDVYSGPLYRSHKIDGQKVRIRFRHTGGGLVARDGKPLTHFTIAGSDGTWMPAEAMIDGDEVVVWNKSLTDPTAVRFGWDQLAEPNLANKEGLPAGPFRTDRK